MPPYTQWSDLLEEEAYLVQMVLEAPLESGTLDQTMSTLTLLRTDLQSCASELSDLDREFQYRNSQGPSSSSTSRFLSRIKSGIGSDHSHEDPQSELLLDATTRSDTLKIEINNLEIRAQRLRRRIRRHEELTRKLKALYDSIFNGPRPSSYEEDEAEKELRRAQQALHQTQKAMECHRTLTVLLAYCDFALSSAGAHLSAVASRGGTGIDSHVEIAAAKTCVVQASIVVDQAKRLDPSIFQQEGGDDLFGETWKTAIFQSQSPSKNTSDSSTAMSSKQALQSCHAAVQSVLKLMRNRHNEHELNLRRAVYSHTEAYERKQILRRRILIRYTGIEEGSSNGGSAGNATGLERSRDVTAGLDKLLATVPTRHEISPAKSDEERREKGRNALNREPSSNYSQTSSLMQPPQVDPNSMHPRSPGLSSDPRGQSSPLSPPDGNMRQRPSVPTDPSESRPTMAQPSGGASYNPQRTFDAQSDATHAQVGFDSPRAAPSPPTSSSRDVQGRDSKSNLHTVTDMQPWPRGEFTGQEASATHRPLPAQRPPLNTAQTEDGVLQSEQYPPGTHQPNLTPSSSPSIKRGILKPPSIDPPPSAPDLTDPWGVKVASAEPARTHPRLKAMINKLRGGDGNKSHHHSNPHTEFNAAAVAPSSRSPPSDSHSTLSRQSSKSSVQRLRFSEMVDLIPRPEVDSDPYSDEDDEYMPPSPKRGSMLWNSEQAGESEEDDEEWVGKQMWSPVIDTGPGGAAYLANASSSAGHRPYGESLPVRSPVVLPLASDLSFTNMGRSGPQYPETVQNSQYSRQIPFGGSADGGSGGSRYDTKDRRDDSQQPYPEQSRSYGRPPVENNSAFSEGMRFEKEGMLAQATHEDSNRVYLPSLNPNLVSPSAPSQVRPVPPAALMTRGAQV